MLDPSHFPDEYRELEEELARPPAAELSDELQSNVMRSVREYLESENRTPESSQLLTTSLWTRLSIGSIAVAAAVMIVVTIVQRQRTPIAKQQQVVDAPSTNHESNAVIADDTQMILTAQHYRLALSESSADWESLLHRETDSFEDLSRETHLVRWRQGTSSLSDEE